MATPYTVTYFSAIDMSGSSTPVTFTDISSWHTVQIEVPTDDMNTIFRWSRAIGTTAATNDTVDYWRFAAMLIRSFFNFDDTMTPLVDVSDGIGTEYYHQFQGGLSFTTPPTAATTETPAAPALNSSQIFPNTFNTLLLRWALWNLYGTSRPAAGTIVGLAKAYELLTNYQAAHAIAKSFWGNTAEVQQMLTALTTNAQERYFDASGFNIIIAGYEGLVDTEAAANPSSGDWNWMTDDILDIPILITMPVFNSAASPMASTRFRLQLVLKDTVQSWKTPYAIGSSPSVATVTTTVPEHGIIDTDVGTARTYFAAADISTNTGAWDIVTDISNHLYVYTEARALRDYFDWLAGGAAPGTAPVTIAPINVHDASGNPVTDVSLGVYEADVSGWMHTNGDNTYVDGSAAPITAFMQSFNEPFYRLGVGDFYNDWNAEPYDGTALSTRLDSGFRAPLDTFDAALATFQAKAPSGGDLAHTPILNAYLGETPTP